MRFRIEFILKIILIIFITIFCIRCFLVRRNEILDYKLEENRILSSYEEKKEKYNLINELIFDVLVQGEYIDTKKIPNDKIQYMIYSDNDNVIFLYSLKNESKKDTSPYAKITLSNEYNVLNEEYSVLESFEEFKEEYINGASCDAFILSILPVFLSLIMISILYFYLRY